MSELNSVRPIIAATCLIAVVGCFRQGAEVAYLGKRPLNYYEDVATKIAYPTVDEPTADPVTFSEPPRTLRDVGDDEVRDMTLAEAIHLALVNNEVIRVAGTLGSASNPILNNPDSVTSIYDNGIQETGVLFGGRGVEAALAAFDTNLTASMMWGNNETIANNPFFGATSGATLTQDTGNFSAALTKNLGNGDQFTVSHEVNYTASNVSNQLFPSSYAGNLQAAYRKPLLAGAGTEFTRIAGPIATSFQGISGVSQGVSISRINSDISVADFEIAVRNLLADVERTYWELHLAYRVYDALRSWREAKAKLEAGGVRNFKPSDEAQARDRYFETRAAAESALASIYSNEVRLRRMLGMAVNDGAVIRPVDEPTVAEFIPDWHLSVTEALLHRAELRQQKWRIQSAELQLKAAKSLTRPRLDFVSSYQVNGFGDDLLSYQKGPNDDERFDSVYSTMAANNQNGWSLGLQMTMPIGFRQAHAQVRNIELRLAKARAVLNTQEIDISHELALSFQDLAQNYAQSQSNLNRWLAAKRRVELFESEVRTGTATLDLLLRAQASLAAAEIEYYQSLVAYNMAIMNIHLRKGTLLRHNSVHVMEDSWEPEAYADALRHAWARSYGFGGKRKKTQPEVFSSDTYVGSVSLDPNKSTKSPEMQPQENSDGIPPLPGEPAAGSQDELIDDGLVPEPEELSTQLDEVPPLLKDASWAKSAAQAKDQTPITKAVASSPETGESRTAGKPTTAANPFAPSEK